MREAPLRLPAWLFALFLLVAPATGCLDPTFREVELAKRQSASPGPASVSAPDPRTLRVAVAAVQSPRDTFAAYSHFLDRVGALVGRRVVLVQRQSYREVNDLLLAGSLDVALLCTGGYIDLATAHPGAVEVLVVPEVALGATYNSLLIVPSASTATSLTDLRGARFAFTDELSLSGHAYATHRLAQQGLVAERFFRSIIYTRSHDRSVRAVSEGLVDGAVVDSLVYEGLAAREAELRTKLKVIEVSPPFGLMPIVASAALPAAIRAELKRILLGLHLDDAARVDLARIGFKRFITPPPGHFAGAEQVLRTRQ